MPSCLRCFDVGNDVLNSLGAGDEAPLGPLQGKETHSRAGHAHYEARFWKKPDWEFPLYKCTRMI